MGSRRIFTATLADGRLLLLAGGATAMLVRSDDATVDEFPLKIRLMHP